MSEHYSINVNGRLMQFDAPVVMGVLNVTPDSFYAGSRLGGDEALLAAARGGLAATARRLNRSRPSSALLAFRSRAKEGAKRGLI